MMKIKIYILKIKNNEVDIGYLGYEKRKNKRFFIFEWVNTFLAN